MFLVFLSTIASSLHLVVTYVSLLLAVIINVIDLNCLNFSDESISFFLFFSLYYCYFKRSCHKRRKRLKLPEYLE